MQPLKVTVMFADEGSVKGSHLADLNMNLFTTFIKRKYNRPIEDLGISDVTALTNLNLIRGEELTLTGLLLFSEKRQYYRPLFTIQCVSVNDDTIRGSAYTDSEAPIDSPLPFIFEKAMGFIDRKMRKLQTGPSFNSHAAWEIPYAVFEELITNALIHRDYFIQSTIKIFVFINRVEIHSPGRLPNALTIDNIKNGISVQRNPILQSLAQYVLPYKGLGTGIGRALALYPEIEFENEVELSRFKVIIRRPPGAL